MAVSMSSSWLLRTWVGLLMVMVRWASATNPDVEALSALRQSLSDPDHVLDSWDPNLVDACTWLHVTCDSDSRVTRVTMTNVFDVTNSTIYPCRDLGMSNLSGKLVPELGNLEHLQYLELFKNNIQGTIPSELGNLKNLVALDLYNNQLSGSIPPELGKLQSLLFLRLNDNKLTGEVPKELSNLHLQVLNLSNNNLSGPVPPVGPYPPSL
ncbi:hypothetical protein Cgig2_001374 [Carnegiea gigantea]|uniref:Leucine-rich repeat-containing N-terminal plant-type domain-containing protein n=1 Tax=Carnegiea gigantea TaxID=171969 RepID=A0A9Q1KVN1_9CARY|nr:hypothetical protein Cgig2_001374 [Carnegiea gigantea]